MKYEKVVMYSTGCPKCRVLAKKMAATGIQYETNSSVEDMQALGISVLPVLSVDGVLMDFSKAYQWINGKEN